LISGRRQPGELARDLEHLVVHCFDKPFHIGNEEVRMGCRIGAAVHPGDGNSAEELLRNAEFALRKSRNVVEPFVFYAVGMNTSVNEALALESRLRRAIEHEEFVLHYQPKLRMADRRICGVEALIRWQDPERGLVAPMRFIPVLEESGLIGVVGRWAMHQALADAKAWRAAGAAPIRVAVNVSPLQLNQPAFATQVAEEIAGSGGEALELEITESVIMEDVDRKIIVLNEIRSLGVDIAIDDFGTGYSSLAYISRLPVTALKIDRAFIAGMTEGPQGQILVSSIIALAHAIGLKVVAEGVETEEQAGLLRTLACDEAQGYLFSKPVPAADVEALLLN
jgi:EAL domain-containing protein (putative c-di-GMP-specific phosphodiesterase class I)